MPGEETVCAVLLAAVILLMRLYVNAVRDKPPRRPPRRKGHK